MASHLLFLFLVVLHKHQAHHTLKGKNTCFGVLHICRQNKKKRGTYLYLSSNRDKNIEYTFLRVANSREMFFAYKRRKISQASLLIFLCGPSNLRLGHGEFLDPRAGVNLCALFPFTSLFRSKQVLH